MMCFIFERWLEDLESDLLLKLLMKSIDENLKNCE